MKTTKINTIVLLATLAITSTSVASNKFLWEKYWTGTIAANQTPGFRFTLQGKHELFIIGKSEDFFLCALKDDFGDTLETAGGPVISPNLSHNNCKIDYTPSEDKNVILYILNIKDKNIMVSIAAGQSKN